MPKYQIQIRESFAKTVIVEASSAEAALKNAEDKYHSGQFRLDPDCFEDVEFRPVCAECETAYDKGCGDIRVVNEGLPDEKWLCFYCCTNQEDTGKLTQCDGCGEVFSPRHLKINPENGKREICPCCGGVWWYSPHPAHSALR